jgi:hypothetical protein
MTANAGIPHLKHRDLKSCCAAVFLRLLNRRFTVNSNLISISYGKQMLPPPAAAHPGVANLAVT